MSSNTYNNLQETLRACSSVQEVSVCLSKSSGECEGASAGEGVGEIRESTKWDTWLSKDASNTLEEKEPSPFLAPAAVPLRTAQSPMPTRTNSWRAMLESPKTFPAEPPEPMAGPRPSGKPAKVVLPVVSRLDEFTSTSSSTASKTRTVNLSATSAERERDESWDALVSSVCAGHG